MAKKPSSEPTAPIPRARSGKRRPSTVALSGETGMQLRTRERILKEAMRLFADQGFAATTIAQIEAAAGLSPGSGALYRHFPSKHDMLAAGIAELRGRIDANRAAATAVAVDGDLPVNDRELAQQLAYVHTITLYGLEASREFVQTLLRSGSALPPEVLATSNDWLDDSIRNTAANLEKRRTQTGIPVVGGNDNAALAYLLLAPIMWSKTLEWNGGLPAGLTHERIGAMWVQLLVSLTGEQGNRSALAPKSPTKKRRTASS